MDYGLGLLL